MERRVETLVVGAGPAGLAAAACLGRQGAPFTIVDQGTTVGSSWRCHYDRLHLHSDKHRSALPFLDFPREVPRYPSRDQVIDYLERYARIFGITPRLNECATSVKPSKDGWTTTTTACVYRSRHVVLATGYNAVPHVPGWPGQDQFNGRILHSSEYRDGNPFRDRSVLVVGLGNSGGDIALDLDECGARVSLSVRGPVNIIPREILGMPILAISIALSRLPSSLADALAAPLLKLTIGDVSRLGFRKLAVGPITQIKTTSRVPLIDIGTVKRIREGRIEVLGCVSSLNEAGAAFDDGSSRPFDAIVAATGFRPGTDRFLQTNSDFAGAGRTHFGSKLLRDAGLHFCGFSVSPTGMLRDIGIEARRIAEQITRGR
jgi:indole-3-pyruvate monooxygenase